MLKFSYKKIEIDESFPKYIVENREKFKDSIELSDDVLSFLASEMRVNIRETIGALNRILAFGRIYNKAPSV